MNVVVLRHDVLRDRDLEASRAVVELVVENADVLGRLDPQGTVFRAVRDVLLDEAVRRKGGPDSVLQVGDRLVSLDLEVVHVSQPDAVVREPLDGEALDRHADDIGIARVCRLDDDAVLLACARQDADLHLWQPALGEQPERLGDADGGCPRVCLGVVAGHHDDRVTRRSGVDRLLDRLSGCHPGHGRRGRRGDTREGETQNRCCTYAQSSLRHFHPLLCARKRTFGRTIDRP